MKNGRQIRKEKIQEAQDLLLRCAANAFYSIGDGNEPNVDEAEARKQFGRIEKLFGYEPGTWKY